MASGLTDGTRVAGYQIDRLVGAGSTASVYAARDLRLGRQVALKVLNPELADSASFRERFVRESQLAASIDHPNIVPIYDAGTTDGFLYIAMRMVDGRDLATLLTQDGPLSVARAVALLGQVASALDAAHARGLVHRDLKPENILVAGRRAGGAVEHVYLTDFGLTKRVASLSGITSPSHFLGTIDYITPEQVLGAPVDARTDVYGLGCVLFESLTGSTPFPRPLEIQALRAHVDDPAPSARALRPGLPEGVDEVLGRALAKTPADRFVACTDLIDALAGLTRTDGRGRGAAVAGSAVAAAPVAGADPSQLSLDSGAEDAGAPGAVPDALPRWERHSQALTRSRVVPAALRRAAVAVPAAAALEETARGRGRAVTRGPSPAAADPTSQLATRSRVVPHTDPWATVPQAPVPGESTTPERAVDGGVSTSPDVPRQLAAGSHRAPTEPTPRPPWRRRSVLIPLAVVALLLAAAGALTVTRLTKSTSTHAVTLPFAAESYHDKGLQVSRTWVLSGGGTELKGELLVVATRAKALPFTEVLPEDLTATVANVTFAPEPARVVQRDPVVEYAPPGSFGSETLRYTVKVPAGPSSLTRLTAWASAQSAAAAAYLKSVHEKPPVTLQRLVVQPATLALTVGKPPATLRLAGTNTDRTAASPSALARAVFHSDHSDIASVDENGAVQAHEAGSAKVTAALGAITTEASVTVAPAPTTQPSLTPTASGSAATRGRTGQPSPQLTSGPGEPGARTSAATSAPSRRTQTSTTSPGTVTTSPASTITTIQPMVQITSPRGTYGIGQSVAAAYSCTDGSGGSGIVSCTGPVPAGGAVDTSTAGSFTFGVTATDRAGNTATSSSSYVVKDIILPTVDPITSPSGTYNQGDSVTASYSCTDTGGSGLASCAGPVPSGSPVDTSTPGSYTFTVTATDGAGNTTAGSSNYTIAEVPSPTVEITSPSGTYTVGDSVIAQYTCSDVGGPGLASCTGPVPSDGAVDTSTAGDFTFTVTATDTAGRTTSKTSYYTVVASAVPSEPVATDTPTP